MDTSQWPQEMVMKSMEEIIPTNVISSNNPLERKVRPQKDQALNCPRCNSTNTKFCYYNNYNLSQPRYFCKTCRRYWTEGGTLRNVPVGGGSRKNKRSSSSSSSVVAPSKKTNNNPQDFTILPPQLISQNPNKIHEGQDLNLGFPSEYDFKTYTELIQEGSILSSSSSRGFINSFIPIIPSQVGDTNNVYSSSSGFSMPVELKPSLDFSLFGGTPQNVHHQDHGNDRFLFPFEDLNLKKASSTNSNATNDHHVQHNNKHQNNGNNNNNNTGNSNGYWNGVLGGGTW